MMLLADAQARLSQSTMASLNVERVTLGQALGRVMAESVQSSLAIPPADNSAMDGFAVRAADVGSGVEMPISQRITAGASTGPLKRGTVARIFTGANVPLGADAVVIQEHCVFADSSIGNTVEFSQSTAQGANIRPRGQDICAGATVVQQGQRLNAVDISLLASIGVADVRVYEPLKVAIFSTGNELVEPGQPLKEGQIYNSNRPLLVSLCHELGYKTLDIGIVVDTLQDTKKALQEAAQDAHVILSSGGVSVGEEDHIKPAIEALGSLDMWKVQIKPGKPVAYGRVNNTAFLGLPGNPVSSFIVFQLLGMPLLKALQGEPPSQPKAFQIASGFDKKFTVREEYIRVKLHHTETGEWVADCFPNLSSGVLSSLSWADGLVRHEADTEIQAGQKVSFLPLRRATL